VIEHCRRGFVVAVSKRGFRYATMLYLCGIDHKRLTYRYQGRDFRLTDVAGNVAEGILV